MHDRYRAALALTSLALLAASAGHHRHARTHHVAAAPAGGIEVYSRRALRRARTILQLKLMELHAMQLERVRRAVEHALSEPTPKP